MKKCYVALAVICAVAIGGYVSRADDESAALRATLSGFQEVPSKLTPGSGSFRAFIRGNQIEYTLTYANLTTPAAVAHIHFGQRGVNGGIMIFLCGGGGKPACPATSGTVSDVITAADVLTISPDQGITAGDFDGALRAIRSGFTYANVHTTRFPGGELRGQIRSGADDE